MRFTIKHGPFEYHADCARLESDLDWKSKGLPGYDSHLFELYCGKDKLGQVHFSTLPGCCGVVVSHGLYVNESWRAKGHTNGLQALREHVAKELGYGAMLATVITANFPEVISSAKNGWKLGPVFRNQARSGNDVAFQIKVLQAGSQG